jgi:hypothetical protein
VAKQERDGGPPPRKTKHVRVRTDLAVMITEICKYLKQDQSDYLDQILRRSVVPKHRELKPLIDRQKAEAEKARRQAGDSPG